MKLYETPLVELMEFQEEDVILTSGLPQANGNEMKILPGSSGDAYNSNDNFEK